MKSCLLAMKYYLVIAAIGIGLNVNAQILNLADSVQLNNASVWGVVSDDGDSLCATTTYSPTLKPHIYMRKINYNNISQQSPLKPLTFDADFNNITNLTDHKSIILNNELFVTFSTQGDSDLFLFKTDLNGNRIDSIVTVVKDSPDPTNDMILTTDNNFIYVLHFNPNDQHHIYKYDTLLNLVSRDSTITQPHNNIGNAIFKNNEFFMFSGTKFGYSSDLVHTRWDNSWTGTATQTIIPSTLGDGNFFSTGVVYDPVNQRWHIAMNHIDSSQAIGNEHIDILSFDNNFNLLERLHVTGNNYTRPHLTLVAGNLYMLYDRVAVGVYMHKYQVQNTTGIAAAPSVDHMPLVYPNPATTAFSIDLRNLTADNNYNIDIYSVLGQQVKTIRTHKNLLEIACNNFPQGIYYIVVATDNNRTWTEKLIIE